MFSIGMLSILFLFGVTLSESIKPIYGSSHEITWDNVSAFAYDFVKSSPTFSFDGVADSLRVDSARISPNNPNEFAVFLTFDSSHAGYGDRTNLILAQVITTHNVHVKVIDGKVTYAVMDGVWDELNQKFLSSPTDLNDLPLEYDGITKYDFTSPRIKLNSTNVIQHGRTVPFDDGKFTLTFSKLIQDSRCPADVVCVYQGDATIKVGIGSAEKNISELELSLYQNNVPQKLLNRYFIKLADLQPYPLSDKKILESDYIATILISSFGIHSPRVQLEFGLDSSDVICKDGLVLIKKLSKDTVGCVTDSTAQKLINRGWGIQ